MPGTLTKEKNLLDNVTSPQNLSLEAINSIGSSYLARRKAASRKCLGFFDTWFHHNHNIATRLQNYKGGKDAYEDWMFLADCFAQLPNDHGEIAKDITMLFNNGFKKLQPAFELIHATHAQNFTRPNGNNPARTAMGLRTTINHYFIQKFQDDLIPIENPNHHGSTHFDSLANGPENISNAIIQNLGSDYLQKYSKNNGCLSLVSSLCHHNQPTALQLKQYSKATTPYEKWMFLAEAYAGLNESHGVLSDAILRVFAQAFHQVPYTHYKTNVASHPCVFYSADTVSTALKGIVNNYYAECYRKELEYGLDDRRALRAQ